MPLPLIIGIALAITGTTGVGLGIHGGVKMKQAKDKLTDAQKRNDDNNARLERMNKSACKSMDVLGENELKVLYEFQQFSNFFERIKNRPEFANIKIGNVSIPKFEGEDIKKVSVGASVLVGGLVGAALGTAGGFAASGVLVGGIIFSCTGLTLSSKADEAWSQMLSNEGKINDICNYLADLQRTAERYNATILRMRSLYLKQLDKMRNIIESCKEKHINWNNLSTEEQLVIENMVLIVGVLYNMCKVQLVRKSNDSDQNIINKAAISKAEKDANDVIEQMNNIAV